LAVWGRWSGSSPLSVWAGFRPPGPRGCWRGCFSLCRFSWWWLRRPRWSSVLLLRGVWRCPVGLGAVPFLRSPLPALWWACGFLRLSWWVFLPALPASGPRFRSSLFFRSLCRRSAALLCRLGGRGRVRRPPGRWWALSLCRRRRPPRAVVRPVVGGRGRSGFCVGVGGRFLARARRVALARRFRALVVASAALFVAWRLGLGWCRWSLRSGGLRWLALLLSRSVRSLSRLFVPALSLLSLVGPLRAPVPRARACVVSVSAAPPPLLPLLCVGPRAWRVAWSSVVLARFGPSLCRLGASPPVGLSVCRSAVACVVCCARLFCCVVRRPRVCALSVAWSPGVGVSVSLVGFCGSRSLSSAFAPLVSRVVAGAVASGAGVCVGCARGGDRLVRCAAPGARVFRASAFAAPGAPVAAALVARSVACVRSVAAVPGGSFVGFVASACPPSVRPSASPSRCFCGSGSGSWASLALAAGLGLRVVVFLCGSSASLPAWWPGGAWAPGAGLWSGGWVWAPAAVPLPGLSCG